SKRKSSGGSKRKIIGRESREVTFEVRAGIEVCAGKQEIFNSKARTNIAPQYLELNFVEVHEINTPEGCEPVVWRFVTTEPANTPEEIAFIIDANLKGHSPLLFEFKGTLPFIALPFIAPLY
ncbi:MAG: hypothetical protein JXR91_16075, partial [Deltaproteobacteria bacterium]|nr:hypothetical protein [Deltaproteobacteria bacterium]